MVATFGAVTQSTFIGQNVGQLAKAYGAPTNAGNTPPGTIVSPLPAQQVGAGPIGNLSEASAGYQTTIRGQPVQIAFPYS